MSLLPRPTLFVIPRAAWRGGMLLALAAALLALGLLSARDGLASGPFNVDGLVSASHISFDGACTPDQIASDSPTIPASGALGTGLVIKTTSTVFGCLATECSPENLIMDSELFTYSNISAATITVITDGSWNNQDLYVQNLPALGTCAAQDHFPNEFPSSGYIFVGSELLQYDSRDSSKFHIIGRGAYPTATAHATGGLVRAQNLLKLKARAVPRYPGGPPTTEAAHGVGTTVRSPKVYTNCRALLLEPMGTAQVGSRSRCYFVLEPGYNPNTCPGTPASCFWPDAALPIEEGGLPITALQPLHPVIYHDLSEGTLAPSGALHLETQFAGFNCFTQIEGQLWVQVFTDTTLDKVFTTGDEDDGEFQIWAFTNPTCTLPAAIPLGSPNDLTSIQLSASQDTDGDGCPDAKELSSAQFTGGLRDPFNQYDYFNPTHDHQNRIDDILRVVAQFHKDDTDSNPGLPPYVFEMQTMLNGGIGAGGTTITVDSTAGATSTGVLLVDAERMRYTGKTGTSFTGVSRGYLGTVAASHGDNATVTELHYDQDTDRTPLGPSEWNVGKPDGQIRIADILSSVKQFHHDC